MSKVVLDPLSYSAAIPSLAISADFNCTFTEFKKLLDDSKLDHALATLVSLVLTAWSNNNLFLFVKLVFLLILCFFFPPE